MNYFLLILAVLSLNAQAKFPSIHVRNMHGNYLDQKGTAYAESAKYKISKVRISHEDISLNFDKKEKNLIINDDTTTVDLNFDFSFLNIFKAFSFKALDIFSNQKKFGLLSGDVELFIAPKKYSISDFYIETDISNLPIPREEDITIIDGLTLNAAFSMRRVSFSNFDDEVFEQMKLENPNEKEKISHYQNQNNKINIPMIIRNVNYKIHKGRFTGRALIDSYINLWFRVAGDITTNKENTFMKIYIRKAKLGIFSIRRTILRMISALDLDAVEVDGYTIHVDLRNVALGQQKHDIQKNHK